MCGAEALALWIPLQDGLILAADWRLDPTHDDLVRGNWARVRADVGAGRRLRLAEDVTLIPLLNAGVTLGAVAYVGALPAAGARRVFFEETLSRLARLLAAPLSQDALDEGLASLVPFDLEGDVEAVERRSYSRLLLRCGWDVTLAAASLGITRQSFYERLEELDLLRTRRRPLRP